MSVVSASPYAFGAKVTLGITLKVNGVLTDPTTITLTYKAPGQSGVTTIPGASLVHDSTGTYHYDVIVSTAGTWYYCFTSTGAAAGAEEASFAVRTLETV